MGFRFRKSITLGNGLRGNITGRGLSSVSVGKPGSTLNVGRSGIRVTAGIPGTGMSYSSRIGGASTGTAVLIALGAAKLFTAAFQGNRGAQIAVGLLMLAAAVGAIAHFFS
jgi:hypothetical protein